MARCLLKNRYVAEVTHYAVDFTAFLPSGVSCSGTPVVTISVYTGVDATPQAMLVTGGSGPALAANVVSFLLHNGVAGVIYVINISQGDTGGGTNVLQGFVAVLPSQP